MELHPDRKRDLCAHEVWPDLRVLNTVLRGCLRTGDVDCAVKTYRELAPVRCVCTLC